VKLQLDWFPLKSDVEQVTVVVPFWKVDPEGGLQTGAQIAATLDFLVLTLHGQLSVTVGAA
jgi:hypothetical protein